MKILRLPLVLLLLLLAGCDDAVTTPTITPKPSEVSSGVQGLVLLGPMCAEAQNTSPCPNIPYETTIAFRVGDKTVATVASGADGRFQIKLPPGEYVLVPSSSHPVEQPRLSELPILVTAGEYVTLIIEYDSGIR